LAQEKESLKSIGNIFVVIGATFLVIYAIFYILGGGFSLIKLKPIALGTILSGIALLVIAIIILSSYGLLQTNLKFEQNWLINIVLGATALILGGEIGAILIIIGALLHKQKLKKTKI